MIWLIGLLACTPTPDAEDTDTDGESVPFAFLAVGDTGEVNAHQAAVASAMASVCADKRCDLVLLLGDNIYETGVDSADDPQWEEKFEVPFAGVDLPFYAVLGNHDYGYFVIDPSRAQAQVSYSARSEKFFMPDTYYTFESQGVGFWGLDTMALVYETALASTHGPQVAWLQAEMARTDLPDWRIGFGHHPYLSNGVHGDAGSFDGSSSEASGASFKAAFDDSACGTLDLYLAGHDHDLEWLEPTCAGTELIVSGSGAKLRGLHGTHATRYQAEEYGFVRVEVHDSELRVEFYLEDGSLAHSGTVASRR